MDDIVGSGNSMCKVKEAEDNRVSLGNSMNSITIDFVDHFIKMSFIADSLK